jgi:Response regulator containing CheY-like receiver domain and AraC-type DNA-binding domain
MAIGNIYTGRVDYMIRVLIVDDEYLIRKHIINSIKWENLKMKVVGEAADGEQALQMVEQLRPQVMIVDIKIPFIDGITLSKMVHKQYADIKIIILTGFDEFNYAREAIEASVVNYLLKPVDAEMLTLVLAQTGVDIRKKAGENRAIRKEQHNKYITARDKFIKSLFSKNPVNLDNMDILVGMEKFNLNIDSRDFIVVDFVLEKFTAANGQFDEFRMCRYIANKFKLKLQVIPGISKAFHGLNNDAVLFVSLGNSVSYRQIMDYVWGSLCTDIKQRCGLEVAVSSSMNHNSLSEITEAYYEAVMANKTRFLFGNDHVLYYENTFKLQHSADFKLFYDTQDILKYLRVADRRNVLQSVNQIFDILFEMKTGTDYALFVVLSLITILSEFNEENGVSMAESYSGTGKVIDYFKGINRLNDIKAAVIRMFEDTIDYVSNSNNKNSFKLVKKAKDYIEKFYSNPAISLDDISDSIQVSACYLSKIFKQESGISLVEYLTVFRLNRAKKLIDEQENIYLYRIAESVGYNDPYYFSKCFKRQFGITPSQYILKKK